MYTFAVNALPCITQSINLTGRVGRKCPRLVLSGRELRPEDMRSGMDCVIEYNTTQRVSKSGTSERVVKVLRQGMLSETEYYRPRYGDQPGRSVGRGQ